MKHINILIAISGLLTLNGCGDNWMDLESSTSVSTDNAIMSESDAESAINGIYNAMQSYEYYGARMTYYADVTGEDAQAESSTKRSANYYTFSYNKDNAPSSFWNLPYYVIRLANNILSANPDYISDDMKGQALAIRALAHFDVTRVYGYPYTKNNGESWGAVLVLNRPAHNTKPRRNTVSECYAQIITDLKDAIPLLSKKKNSGKINQIAAKALLARVYLYQGDNTNALKMAEEVLADAQTAGYQLWTNEEYAAAWGNGSEKEILFKIINTATDNAGNESVGNLYHEKGYKDIIPSDDFKTLLKADSKDVRLALLGSKYYLKYQGNSSDEDWRAADVPIIRLSEVYLIAAEAAVKEQDNAKALTYINEIVKRANPDNSVSGTVTIDQVLTERRKELMGEGHRLFDAMRNNVTIERLGESHFSKQTIKIDDFKIILPIPKREMEANENMRDQQNPGY